MNDDWDDDSVSAPSQNPTGVSWNGSQRGSKPPAGRGRGASTLISQLNSVKISSDNGWGVGKSAANPVTGTNGFNSKTTNGDEWGAPAAVVPVKAPTNFDDSWGVTTPVAKLPAAAAPVKAPTNFDDSWGVAAPAAQAPAKPPTSFADSWGSAPPTSSTFKNSVEDQPRGGGWGSSTENSSAGGWKGGAGGGNRACHKCGEEGHMSRECPNGGGGGGGSRACFKCGDEGHMSRDCPTGGGGSSRACHKCGEEGHMSRECPKGGGGGKGCFKCGDEGHMSRDCPTGGSGGGGGSRACFKCGDEGHMSRDCPTGGGGGGGSRACHKCGEEGHMSRECPKGGGGGGGGRGCFKCGEEGHMSRECPTGGEGEGGGDKKCFKCHETGHMSKDCPNPFSDVTEDGKPRELYIPPEVTSDEKELFEGIQTGANFSRFDQIALQVTGDDVPQYITSFEDAGLRPLLLDNIRNSGYLKPTPVQKGSIAVILAKRDLIASAVTGSGKTAAYLVPVINILLESGVNGGSPGQVQTPEVVIIAPTRELAVQIHHESRKFSHNSTLKSVIIYGGTSVAHQRSAVQSGCNILVATAGRLKDFVERQFFDFSNVKFFILDEADRMLDMGFEKDIDIVARHSTMPPPGQRRTLMFSATFPPEVQQMAKKYLVPDYIFVTTGNVGGTNPDVYQEFIEVSRNEKRTKLMEVLTGIGDSKVIVFVESKKTADFIAAFLCNNQLQCTSIHGDRLQSQRESALREFKRGQRNVLVATNVAARGLDIAGVEYVINYDLPADVEEYVHRIGRTGRVGNTGKSISFFDVDKDGQNGGKLVEKLVQSGSDVPLFLQQYVSGVGGMGFNIHAPSMQSNFSSRDVRRFGDKHEKDDGRKIEAEETWD